MNRAYELEGNEEELGKAFDYHYKRGYQITGNPRLDDETAKKLGRSEFNLAFELQEKYISKYGIIAFRRFARRTEDQFMEGLERVVRESSVHANN